MASLVTLGGRASQPKAVAVRIDERHRSRRIILRCFIRSTKYPVYNENENAVLGGNEVRTYDGVENQAPC